MYVIKINNMKSIPLSIIDNKDRILDDLTIKNPAYEQAVKQGYFYIKVPKYIFAYRITPKNIEVPRYYSVKKYLKKEIDIKDIEVKWEIGNEKIDVEFDIPSLDGYEYEQKAVDAFNHKMDGIIVAPPGSGKTVMGLRIIEQKKLKTIIICPTDTIRTQWVDLLSNHTNGKILHIKGRKSIEHYDGTHFAISTIQSLLDVSKSHPIFSYYNYLIIDEVHRTGAPQFNKVISKFNSYRLGLTATPIRSDNLDFLYKLHVGEIEAKFSYEETGQYIPKIISETVKSSVLPNSYRYLSNYYTAIWKEESFVDRVVQIIIKHSSNRSKSMVLVDRRLAIDSLTDKLTAKGFDVGSVKGTEKLIDISNKKIIISSWQKGLLGYNNRDIDSLFIISGVGTDEFAEQSVGRILRAKKGKKSPIVIDISTNKGPLHYASMKRMRAWRRLGWDL